jgi:superfamily II DNA/RNA helicase
MAATMGLSVAVVFGGVKYGPQMKALAGGVDVLVATPGRLIDHLQRSTLTLDGVEIFVLDEADQMLDLGFIVPIRRIEADAQEAPEPVLLGHHAEARSRSWPARCSRIR